MFNDLVLAMSQTLLILFSLTYVFKQGMYRLEHYSPIVRNVIIGIIFGLFGVVNILMGVTLAPGILIDLRNPLVLVAGIYGGGIGAFLSAGIIVIYRVTIVGGIGSSGAALGMLGVALLATYWFYKKPRPTTATWAFLGLTTVMISVISGYITLPDASRIQFIEAFIPTAVVFYPVLTVLLASLVSSTVQEHELRRQLAISQQRFRAIFDQTFQFVGLLERNGVLIEANQTALAFAGLQPEDVINKPFWEAKWWSLSEKTRTDLQVAIKRAAQGEFVRYNADVLGMNNHVITIDFSLKPVFDTNGAVSLIIPEGRDITAELLAQKQKTELRIERERNLTLNQFIADSSHHMRTPIAIIGTSHHLMTRHIEQVQDIVIQLSDVKNTTSELDTLMGSVSHKLQTIIEACERRTDHMGGAMKRFNALLDNLTELASLDIVRESDSVPINMTQLLKSLFEDHQPSANEHDLQFIMNVADNLPPFQASLQQIRRIFENLIENAIRYTPRGGQITLTGNSDGNHLFISVKDTGIGIPTSERGAVFDRFYRAQNAQVHTDSGSGLGLAIVKQIIEYYNGKISVESEEGNGTTFTVILPLSRTQMSSE